MPGSDMTVLFSTTSCTAPTGVHSIELQFYTGGEDAALVLLWNWDKSGTDTSPLPQCARRRRLAGIPGSVNQLFGMSHSMHDIFLY